MAAFQENISLREVDTKMGEMNSVFGIGIAGTTFWFYKMDKQRELGNGGSQGYLL